MGYFLPLAPSSLAFGLSVPVDRFIKLVVG